MINVFLSFLLIIILGRKFGIGIETDTYFFALVFADYLRKFISLTWTSIKHYYIEFKVKDTNVLNTVYVVMLNNIVLASLIIILLYYFITGYLSILTEEVKAFMDVFIFFILVHSLLTFNKKILNLEKYYASVYLVEIFVAFINLMAVAFIMTEDIITIAYSTITASIIVIFWQFREVFKLNGFKYKFIFYNKNLSKELFKNSIKLEFSSILYGSKDIVVASIFTSAGSGIYSLYSYASKFVGVISQVVTAPAENVYSAKIGYIVANKEFNLANKRANEMWQRNSILFLISVFATYMLLPIVLKIMLNNQISENEIENVQFFFSLLAIYFLLKVLEIPYKKILYLFKYFNFDILANITYFIIVISGFYIISYTNIDYWLIIISIILAQFIKFVMLLSKHKRHFKKILNHSNN